MNKYCWLMMILTLYPTGKLLSMDIIEKYRQEKLQLLECPPCEAYKRYYKHLTPLDNELFQSIMRTIPSNITWHMKPNPHGDHCQTVIFNGLNFLQKRLTAQATAQTLNSTCILLKAQRLQMPYQASAWCNLEDMLWPYIKDKKKCTVVIDKTEELSEDSADALRNFIRNNGYHTFLSFIFLASKGRICFQNPLRNVLADTMELRIK